MSYPQGAPGGPGFSSSQQPTTQFAAPTQQFNTIPEADAGPAGPSKLPVFLNAGIAALGLLVYLSSFAPQFAVDDSGFPGGGTELSGASLGVLFGLIAAVLAALLAGVSLLPKQPNYTGVVAAVAVLAFLLVIYDAVNVPAGIAIDYGLYLVIAFTLLQAAVALVVLLFDAGVITPPVARPKYEQPQQQYGQYPGGYYGQPTGGQGQHHQPPQHQQRPGYPTPYGGGGYPNTGANTGGFTAVPQSGPPTPPTGFPTYGQPPAGNSPTSQTPTQHQTPSSSQSDQSSS